MESMLTAAALLGLSAIDAGTSMQFVIPLAGDAERRIVTYHCEGVDQPFFVEYINAAPNFLAIIPVEAKAVIFVSTIAASGVRYASGPFEWWTKGSEATFSDLRVEPAAPVPCVEAIEAP